MTTQTITNQPLTAQEAAAHLNTLYRIATYTGIASGDPHYEELACGIHSAILSVLQGVDPAAAMTDLRDLWREGAALIPDGAAAVRAYAWADRLGHMVTR